MTRDLPELDGNWHAEVGHSVERVLPDLCLALLAEQSSALKAAEGGDLVSENPGFDGAPLGISAAPVTFCASELCVHSNLPTAQPRPCLALNIRRSGRENYDTPQGARRYRSLTRLAVSWPAQFGLGFRLRGLMTAVNTGHEKYSLLDYANASPSLRAFRVIG